MSRIYLYTFLGCSILLGVYYFNKQKSYISGNEFTSNEVNRAIASDSLNQSVIETAMKNKEIPLELSRSLERASLLLIDNMPDLQGELESDLPIIENELKSAPYPNEYKKRYALILELSNLIQKETPEESEMKRIRTFLKNEVMHPNYSEIESMTLDEKKIKQKILVKAFQLNIQLQSNLEISVVAAKEMLSFHKDYQTRTTLMNEFVSMNPSKANEINDSSDKKKSPTPDFGNVYK